MTAVSKAGIGGVAWAAYVAMRVSGLQADAWAHALLLFAALVLVPLSFDLFAEEEEAPAASRLLAWAQQMQLAAALLLVAACGIAPGLAAGALTLPWLALTVLLASIGVVRMRAAGLRRPLDRLCADIALVFVAVGGAWTLAERSGFQPLQFERAVVALTAVHFHYAGLLLPLFAGLVQRELWFSRFAARGAVGVVLGVPAVAFGITATQLGWGANIEAAAGAGLALAGMAVAVLQVRIALEARRTLATRVLLGLGGASLFFAMVFAALYAMRATVAPFPWLGVPQMRALHGTINAFGFGLCGVLGWRGMGKGPVSPESRVES
jgi:hypothetical protein